MAGPGYYGLNGILNSKAANFMRQFGKKIKKKNIKNERGAM